MDKEKNDKSNVPVSTKTTFTSSIVDFTTKFSKEIKELISHIDRVHQQFRAAKEVRQIAMEQEDTITIHLDWSENFKLKQARREKASYYYEHHISILSGYVWKKNDCFSFGSISDDTNHMFEATWAALQPLLDLFKNDVNTKITNLIFISDSPVSQYRNKTAFYCLKKYATDHHMTMKWIYLAAGHGKGVADGVSAAIKKKMDDAVTFHPDEGFNNVLDLFNVIKDKTNIKHSTYKTEDIDFVAKIIPTLTAVKGTATLHQVTVKIDGELYGKDTSFSRERLL
ncbi:unnamed protein product [Adineta ricciae]|uniref:Uncharacterized protein n=1 Tax=Adineta ricciae TaxID=249248 RepID=A0A815P799_ADIRI|nr:unnamed protein product [Adineta ricciae]